jgi:predicted transcriptional regulator
MPACNKYDLAEDQLKAFTRSSVRSKAMLCLKNGPKGSGELEKELGLRATTILHTLKDLIEEDLVARDKHGYNLTNIGRIQAMLLDDLVSSIVALDKQKEFWLNHDISGIPLKLQKKIGMLIQSNLIISDSTAILKSHEFFLKELEKAKEIYGVSPIIAPGHGEITNKAIRMGTPVELILTDKTLSVAIREDPNSFELLNYDNFKLYRIGEDVRIAFTVTDSFLSLGLYRLDGTYDLTGDLVCVGEEAREWGMELFEYYRDRAERIKGQLSHRSGFLSAV